MYGKYSLFLIALVALYAAVLSSWEFFRPIDNKDVSSKQYDILRQSDQFLSTRDNVEFQSVSCSSLHLKLPTGNRLLGVDANLNIVPVDLKLDLVSNSLQWDSLQLRSSLTVGDNLLNFSEDVPTLDIRHKSNHEFVELQSYFITTRTKPMVSLQSELQTDPFNASFMNVLCNESVIYRLTNDGSHIYKSYYDKPIMELETFTTGSRVSPVIRITQDNNTTPFFTCRQNADTMFSIKSNGDLQWRNSWNINTTSTNLNLRYMDTTYAIFKSENADVEFKGNMYLGTLVNASSALYFNGAGNDTSFSDCYIMNRTRSTNDTSELLIQKGRNTNDQIRFRCSNFTFQTPSSNENADNRGDNNDRFTINNTSVNTFGNNLAVTSSDVNLFSTNLVATSSGVNMMDSKFVMNNTSLQVFNSITASTNSANMMNGTLVVTPNTITTTGDVNIGSSGQPKTLRLNQKVIGTRAYFTRYISGFNNGSRRTLSTDNVDDVNTDWRVFCFQWTATTGGNPAMTYDTDTFSDGGITAESDDTIAHTSVDNNGFDGNNCLQVQYEGFYRLDFDIVLQGANDTNDQRLRWMIIKNKQTSSNNSPIAVGYVDIDTLAKHFHLCATASMVPNDRLYIYYQNWDQPDNVGFIGAGTNDNVFWNYASITMHSI